MISDALTVMWKEWREWLLTRGNLRGGLVGVLFALAVFGVLLPLNSGPSWLRSPGTLFFWLWLPLFLVSGVVADAFAGERERHTLETLLASRLPDRSILWGKVGAAVSYAWGLTMLSLLLGAVTTNIASSEGTIVFYAADAFAAIVVLSLLTTLVAAAAGVLVSLRARSVRQAQQTLSIATMALVFVPIFALQSLPAETQARLLRLFTGASVWLPLAAASGALLLVASALMALAQARFRRSRLVAD